MEKKYNFYDKNLIGHTEIRNLDCFYFTRYYPVNKYGYNENQDFIFEFKEGTCPEIYARIFSRTILSLFGDLIYGNQENHTKFLEKTIILPVPASTQEKHKQRYEDLFRLISEKTGVINGYDVITVSKNREASHLVGKLFSFSLIIGDCFILSKIFKNEFPVVIMSSIKIIL